MSIKQNNTNKQGTSTGKATQARPSRPAAVGAAKGLDNFTAQTLFSNAALKVSAHDDPDERAAAKAASRLDPSSRTGPAAEVDHGARSKSGATPGVGSVPERTFQRVARHGRHLDGKTREFYEARFDHDFSHVRVHTDDVSNQLAQRLNATALTVGNDIVFARGKYRPDNHHGDRLLTHELTHVVQQARGGRSRRRIQRNGPPTGGGEQPVAGSAAPDPLLAAGGIVDWAGLDVSAYTNRELLTELTTNQAWLDTSGTPHLDYFDRQDYQQRLQAEKDSRIAAGHVWLSETNAAELRELMVLSGAGDRVQVSSFSGETYLDAAAGGEVTGKVMSAAQFQQFLADNGIPTVNDEQAWNDARLLYQQRQQQPAGQGFGTGAPPAINLGSQPAEAPWQESAVDLAPIVGTASGRYTSPRYARATSDRFARGFLASGAHGSIAENRYGARQGGLDLNSAWWADASLTGQPSGDPFLRFMQRHGPAPARRLYAPGPSSGRTGPNPGFFDSGAGWQRGNYPMADFDVRNHFAIAPVSVKASIREEWASRRGFFLEGHAALVGTDQRGGGASLAAYLRNAPSGTTQADVARAGTIAINPDDVSRLQDIYQNPFATEAPYQEGGRTVTPNKMNIERNPVQRVLNGYLQASGPVTINGVQYTTVQQLLTAYDNGNGSITRQQVIDALRPATNAAANAVRSNETPRSYLNELIRMRRAQGRGSRRPIELLRPDEYFANQLYGRPRATAHSMGRGGAGGMLIGSGMQALMVAMNPEDYEDPGGAIIEAAGTGLVTGSLEAGLEHQFASRAAERALTSGAGLSRGNAIWQRASASGRAGGIIAGGVETLSILTEDREHSAEEVILRVGRAGGIGYVSTVAGAAIGTAIGGPVGFIAGLVVGLAVGAVLEAVIPRPGANQNVIAETIEEIAEAVEWGMENDPGVFVLPLAPAHRNYARYGSAFPRPRSPLDVMREMQRQRQGQNR